MESSTISVFDSFISDLNGEISTLTDNFSSWKVQGGSLESYSDHLKKIGLCCEAISKECTRLAVTYSRPPEPTEEEKQRYVIDLGRAVDVLLAWTKSFPHSGGRLLCKLLQQSALCILRAVAEFLNSVRQHGCSENQSRLIATGSVWESCDQFKRLPEDVRSAGLAELQKHYDIVSDALAEIQESLKDQDSHATVGQEDNGHPSSCCLPPDGSIDHYMQWSDAERTIVSPTMGLLMASKGCLKKLRSSVASTSLEECCDHVSELDDVVDAADGISPCTDEVVLAMYPPIDLNQLLLKCSHLSEALEKTLFITSSGFLKDKASWTDFVRHAVAHNLGRLKALHPVSSIE